MMRISVFIYIVTNILLVQILASDNVQLNDFIQLSCLVGILTLGLAHGAIDDILYKKNNDSINKTDFILKYLVAILSYFGLWILVPNAALILFLLLSGYHFGQAQFAIYNFRSNKTNKLLNTSWGMMIILLLFYFNKELLLESASFFPAIPTSLSWMLLNSTSLLAISCIVFCSVILDKYFKKEIKGEAILFEIFLIGLTTFSFKLFDPFISFSLFFIIIHSIETLTHEFDYFKTSLGIKKLRNFIKSLIPFTVISVIGIGLILTMMSYFGYYNYLPFVILILISSITAPHSFIMNEFYSSELKSNSN
ncbi:MAG: beta-carotene 15,15'-dioxygenase, Brp/Blh family [Saprospiraceae bacterium]|nr:beta-carotene 15,15'-dioxygenase, Brp/Blh family [Saprospiraceae bacterium]